MILKRISKTAAGVSLILLLLSPLASLSAQQAPLLTVKEIMNAIITPMTSTIWGAYQLQSDEQWQQVENAALTVIAAGNLLAAGGAGENEANVAQQADWQTYNRQMIEAARGVLAAVADKDEEALSSAGNDALYPPCESCHQQYQAR